jgi:hypothetical protein
VRKTRPGKWVLRHQHTLLAILWVALVPPALLWWKESVLFVILLSLYANYESSMAAREAREERGELEETHAMVKETHAMVLELLGGEVPE